MMALEDLKEKFQSNLKAQWEQFQETPLYIQTQERFENLTPLMQKLTLVGVAVLISAGTLYVPWSSFSTSSQYLEQFDETRQSIRDLLKASREAQGIPDIAVPPSVTELKNLVDSQIQMARLLPEQLQGTEISNEQPPLIPQGRSQGVVKISLAKLNLRQILDLGFGFQSINSSVKLVDFSMAGNAQDERFYDVVYKLAVLAVPDFSEPPEPEPPTKKKGR